MKTILPPCKYCYVLFLLILCSAFSPVFGQSLTVTAVPNTVNKFKFSVSMVPLRQRLGSMDIPYYSLLIHYGDGNFTRRNVYQNGVSVTVSSGISINTYSFPVWEEEYEYKMSGTYSPSVTLVGKYTPPDEPPSEFVVPGGPVISGPPTAGSPSIAPAMLPAGRAISLMPSSAMISKEGRQTTFTLAWLRDQDLPGSIAVFYNGLRGPGGLAATAPAGGVDNSILEIVHENRPNFNIYGSLIRKRVVEESTFSGLTGKYDSFFYMKNLDVGFPFVEEGRDFLSFKNKKLLNYTDQKVSILAIFISKNQARKVDDFKLAGLDFSQLALPVNSEGYVPFGDGYVYDWVFYEDMPTYVHDPNEIVITSMVKNGAGDFDMTLHFTSCSAYESNVPVPTAVVEFTHSELLNGWDITNVYQTPAQNPTSANFAVDATNHVFKSNIAGISLPPGGCFTMEIKGVLPAAKEELAYLDGKILSGCVFLAGESSFDMADLCSDNLKYDDKRPEFVVPISQDPCAKPGIWNLIKCLCQKSPLPCWLVALLVVALLLWLFFRKKS